jgi:hypothetical protein
MFKKQAFMIVILVFCSMLLTATPVIASTSLKINAGGWFYNNDDLSSEMVSFGLNAQQISDTGNEARGKFQMIIRHPSDDMTIVHGTITEKSTTGFYQFGGTCSENGEGDWDLYIAINDNGEPGVSSGDWIYIMYWSDTGIHEYSGDLQGGNAQYKP